jgi:hypothetical protein
MARYDRGFGDRDGNASAWWGQEADFDWGEPRGPNVFWGRDEPRGYDRGVYGGDYPQYGGYPGDGREGIHYGGYDAGFAREPFMPEEAYRRHPEYARRPRRVRDRWPDRAHGLPHGSGRGDAEVKREVLGRLYGDEALDADRIRVDVEDGIVTLRGEVEDLVEARYAWEDAWDAAGVHGVVNNLHVRVDVPADPHDVYMVQTTRHWR